MPMSNFNWPNSAPIPASSAPLSPPPTDMPSTHIHPDYETMSAAAANFIADRLQQKRSLLLCLATGSTPTRTYELLAQRPKSLFDQVRILKLDEWGGIPLNSPASCETYLRQILIDP